jgi:hypothetical protein
MEQKLSILALALAASAALLAPAGAYAAPANHRPGAFIEAAVVGPSFGVASADAQRDVIEPPSSVDPGMSLDPPQTGAKMPIIHPPVAAPNSRLILPR